MKRIALLLLPLVLAACSPGADDSGGVSSSEARQLNDAAAVLDSNSASAETVQLDDPDDTPDDTQGNTQ